MRHYRFDQIKSKNRLMEDYNKICIVPGCGHNVTIFKGPGDKTHCREHQISRFEYGGTGVPGRYHTYHRSQEYTCIECGWAILEDPRLADVTDEMEKRQIARIILHGDHSVRKADGGEDTAENVRSLCAVCHAKKTVLNKDNLVGKENPNGNEC
jgi:5-methylcytosine-specific restriction endonuclease McrA